VRFMAKGVGVGCGFVPVWETPPPTPAIAQPTSIPVLIDHSQTNPKTRVLTRIFKTGKRSGYRAGD